jgi:uncharacterized membrane protein YfcA
MLAIRLRQAAVATVEGRSVATDDAATTGLLPSLPFILYQFLVAIYGGYAGSRVAQRSGQRAVRYAIVVIGLRSGLVMLGAQLRR